MDGNAQTLVWGLGMVALVGGGIRAALLFWGVRRGEAQPVERAKVLAWVFTAVALAGLATVIWTSK